MEEGIVHPTKELEDRAVQLAVVLVTLDVAEVVDVLEVPLEERWVGGWVGGWKGGASNNSKEIGYILGGCGWVDGWVGGLPG